MKSLNSLSIKVLLQFSSIVIICLLLLFFYVDEHFHESEEQLITLQIEIRQSKTEMLMLRRHEKDFISRNDGKYRQLLENGVKELESKIALINRTLIQEDVSVQLKSGGIFNLLNTYSHSFNELGDALEELNGKGKNKGLFEQLKEASINFERELLAIKNDELNNSMLDLQEHIYDFYSGISSKNSQTIEFEKEKISHLMNGLRNNIVQLELTRLLGSYMFFEKSYLRVQEMHEIAGYNHTLGFHGQLRAAIKTLETELNELFDIVTLKTEEKINAFYFYSKVLSIVMFVSVFSVLTFVIITISRLEKTILQSKDQEIKANKAKSSFLANMSHEIRTPLNGIIGMTEILSASKLNAVQKDYLATINASSQTLLMLINDVLDLSKIESGKLEVNAHSCNLKEVIFDTAALIAPKAQQKQINIKVLMSESLPFYIKADEKKIRQVLMNLASNAVKFTEVGSITFKLSLEKETDTHYRLFFSVKDTGLGIEESKHQQVFEEFKQEDNDTSKNFGGTGLGLAISSKMIKMMGDKIKIESSKGVGSEFYFTLDLEKDAIDHLTSNTNKHKTIIYCSVTPKALLVNEVSGFGFDIDVANTIDEIKIHETSESIILLEKEDFENEIDIVKSKYPQIPLVLLRDNKDKNDIKSEVDGYVTYPLLGYRLENLLNTVLKERENEKETTNGDEVAITPKEGMVLIVEDNKVNQQVVSINLKMLGLEFKIANNGVEAVELYKQYHQDIQIILMDCMMPVMDGFEATEAIRKIEINESVQRTTIIALTASILDDDIQRCFDCGMDDYLPKPFKREVLQEKVGKFN